MAVLLVPPNEDSFRSNFQKNQVSNAADSSSDSYLSDTDNENKKYSKNAPSVRRHKKKNHSHGGAASEKPDFYIKRSREWKVAAAILDRLFMFFGVIVLVLVTVAYLLVMPNMHASKTVPKKPVM